MKVRVSDPAFIYDLICSLKQAAYVAAQASDDTVIVGVPEAGSQEQARMHLGLYLANWRARHPGVVADFVQ